MFAMLSNVFRIAVYGAFAFLAYTVLVRGRAEVPTRRWGTVILLVVLTYPWGLVSSVVISHAMNGWLSTHPVHAARVIAELQPVLTMWHDIPLVVALVLGFRLLGGHWSVRSL